MTVENIMVVKETQALGGGGTDGQAIGRRAAATQYKKRRIHTGATVMKEESDVNEVETR